MNFLIFTKNNSHHHTYGRTFPAKVDKRLWKTGNLMTNLKNISNPNINKLIEIKIHKSNQMIN